MKIILKSTSYLIVLTTLFLSSCSTSLEVSKRKYRKGYHVNWVQKPKVNQERIAMNSSSEQLESIGLEIKEITKLNAPTAKLVATANQVSEENHLDNIRLSPLKESKKIDSELSFKERRSVLRTLKKRVNALKHSTSQNASDSEVMLILLFVLCLILPPLAVYLLRDFGNEFLISIVLTLLFWLPGVVYAFLLLFDKI